MAEARGAPWWDLSLGTVLALVGMAIGGLAAFFALQTDVAVLTATQNADRASLSLRLDRVEERALYLEREERRRALGLSPSSAPPLPGSPSLEPGDF